MTSPRCFSLLVMYVVLSIAPIEEQICGAICLMVVASGVAAALVRPFGTSIKFPPSNDGRAVRDDLGAPSSTQRIRRRAARAVRAGPGRAGERAPHPRGARIACRASGSWVKAFLITLSARSDAGLCVMIRAPSFVLIVRRRLLVASPLLMPSFALILLLGPCRSAAHHRCGEQRRRGAHRDLAKSTCTPWLQHPVFGLGAGSAVSGLQREPAQRRAARFRGWDRPPHNLVLNTLLNLGPSACVDRHSVRDAVPPTRADPARRSALRPARRFDRIAGRHRGRFALHRQHRREVRVGLVLCAIAQLRTVVRSRSAPLSRLTEP